MVSEKLISLIKFLLPPAFLQILYLPYGWRGSYATWEEAEEASDGYAKDEILHKVKKAALVVRDGGAAFERDSMLFDRAEYAWPVVSSLLRVGAMAGNRLSVLDFGGSLGSMYFQHRRLLQCMGDVTWSIVEQPEFCECGTEHFADGTLAFYDSIATCLETQNPDVALLGSVLQYIRAPFDLLEELGQSGARCIIVDRTPFFVDDHPSTITVQKVPPTIYRASYPSWVFNESELVGFLARSGYDLLADYDCSDQSYSSKIKLRGLIFERSACATPVRGFVADE